MTSNSLVDFFSSDGSDKQQPVDFLKKFHHAMRDTQVTQDAPLVKAFGNYLKTDSPAEEWYTNQDILTTVPTWDNFESAFRTCFPGVQKAKKSSVDLERELSMLKLDKKTLATMVSYGGQDTWSYVVFVEKALDLAKRAGIETMRSSLTGVHDNLPTVFKEKVSGSVASWETFCAEIKAVDIDTLWDWVKKEEVKERKERERDQVNNARFVSLEALQTHSVIPASPTTGIRNQMSRVTIAAAPNQSNTCPANMPPNPFNAGSGGKGNLFPGTNANPRAPATEAQKAALRARIIAFPMQPNTPAGLDAYRDQCCAWLAAFGANQKITELTGFPLLPGGTPLGSGECYVCGKAGHTWQNCLNEQVPFKERQWRNVCGTILGHGRSASTPINFVQAVEDFGWMNSAGSEDNMGQGNRERPLTQWRSWQPQACK